MQRIVNLNAIAVQWIQTGEYKEAQNQLHAALETLHYLLFRYVNSRNNNNNNNNERYLLPTSYRSKKEGNEDDEDDVLRITQPDLVPGKFFAKLTYNDILVEYEDQELFLLPFDLLSSEIAPSPLSCNDDEYDMLTEAFEVRAVLLYNLAIAYHVLGTETGKTELLLKSQEFYDQAYRQVHDITTATVENMTKAELYFIMAAICHNLHQQFSRVFYNRDEMKIQVLLYNQTMLTLSHLVQHVQDSLTSSYTSGLSSWGAILQAMVYGDMYYFFYRRFILARTYQLHVAPMA